MNFKIFITGMIAVLCWIIISEYYLLVYYWSTLLILVSLLTATNGYKKYAFIANTYFLVYISFITWVRTRNYSFPGNTEWWLNNCEHFLFAVVVCLLASLFIKTIVSGELSFLKTLLFTIIIFNATGIINEYFQNLLSRRSFIHLTDDSKKDLMMNLAGTVLFIALALYWHFNKHTGLKNLHPILNKTP